jgi:glycerol-3-phosphate dehydrogenase
VELVKKERLHGMEAEFIKQRNRSALAPEAGIISPWDLCLAFAETAVKNGCELLLNSSGARLTAGKWKLEIGNWGKEDSSAVRD